MKGKYGKSERNNELDELIALSNDEEIRKRGKRNKHNHHDETDDDTDDDDKNDVDETDNDDDDNDTTDDDDYTMTRVKAKRAGKRKSSEYMTSENGKQINSGKQTMSNKLNAVGNEVIVPQSKGMISIPMPEGSNVVKVPQTVVYTPPVVEKMPKLRKQHWYRKKPVKILLITLIVVCSLLILAFIGYKAFRIIKAIHQKNAKNVDVFDTNQQSGTPQPISGGDSAESTQIDYAAFGNKTRVMQRKFARDSKGRFAKSK